MAFQRRQLRAQRHATHQQQQLQVGNAGGQLADLLADLVGQFAGRAQHQRLHADQAGVDGLQQAPAGGGGLAAARLRGHHQVVTGQRLRNGSGLDGGGGAEASFLNGRQQSGCKTQVFDSHYFPLPQSMRRSAWSGQGIRRPDPGDG
ncbi:hypothetical protein G6F57_018690 [Rhizopus arrhizus]|nr:hypothetical protein G6F57_018690 [Rhizopus arrhizus]